MQYQFQVDGRAAAPIRDTWNKAAHDTVNAGYGRWRRDKESINIHSNEGAAIVRIPNDKRSH